MIATLLQPHEVKRPHVQPGEIVIMHGWCVHAGDEGMAGVPAPRTHWYLQWAELEGKDDGYRTYPPTTPGQVVVVKLEVARID